VVWFFTFCTAVLCALPFYIGIRMSKDRHVALLGAIVMTAGLFALGAINILV
jgi:hypothetical protein